MRAFDTRSILFLLACMVLPAACGDDGGDDPDAGVLAPDAAGPEVDAAAPMPDAMPAPDAVPLVGIEGARNAPKGLVRIVVDQVLVTYIKPGVFDDPPGFFVQEGAAGPGLFVAVDPDTLPEAPRVGDLVSFTVTRVETELEHHAVTSLQDFEVLLRGNDVDALVQDLSASGDVVSALGSYDSEYVSAQVTVSEDFKPAGTGYVSAVVDTQGLAGSAYMRLRIPVAVQERAALGQGCSLRVGPAPLWRMGGIALLSAWRLDELQSVTCPNPQVRRAVAASATEVMVELERDVNPDAVASAAFTIDGGLTVTAARADGRRIFLTTSTQAARQAYTVTVASSVTDVFGKPVIPVGNVANFRGFVPRAQVRINELRGTFFNSCDLVELRVIAGGTLEGFRVMEHDDVVLAFPDFTVAKNDLVIVHFSNDSDCNRGNSPNETQNVDQHPQASFGDNFDTAYDWYPSGNGDGMRATDNVLSVVDPLGDMVDAVLLTDGLIGDVSPASEISAARAEAAGQWHMVGGGVPVRGFLGAAFHEHAVRGLAGEGSILRVGDQDSDDRADWRDNAVSSFGVLNEGQETL